MTVVLVRSYSRISGSTAELRETAAPGSRSRTSRSTSTSCSTVDVRVQQADRHGLHVGLLQHVQRPGHAPFVQRPDHRPVGGHALAHAQSQPALHQRLRPRPAQVIQPRIPQPPDLQHIAETLGCDQAGTRPAPLQDCVGRHRAGVQQAGQRREGVPAAHAWRPRKHAAVEVGRRGQRLVPRDGALRVHRHEIGKRPPNVRRRAQTAGLGTSRPSSLEPLREGGSRRVDRPALPAWPEPPSQAAARLPQTWRYCC